MQYELNSPAFWSAVGQGEITWEEAERLTQNQQIRRDRSVGAQREKRRARDPRANRPKPKPSRQYVQEMDTTLYRDERVTQGAKVLMTIIVAEIGNGSSRMLNKEYLAQRISRSARTVQRYLAQLRTYKYLPSLEVVRNAAGWITGQVLRVPPHVRPFWHPARRAWERENAKNVAETLVKNVKTATSTLVETLASHTKAYGLINNLTSSP